MTGNPEVGKLKTHAAIQGLKQTTVSFGQSDREFLDYIQATLGCGQSEAVRTCVRVYAALLMSQGKK